MEGATIQRAWIPTEWGIPSAGVSRSECQMHPPLSVEGWANNIKIILTQLSSIVVNQPQPGGLGGW